MSDIDNIFTKFQEIFKKAETLNDSASFSFIKANLPMLKNSTNPQHRFVAMRLENKLKDNENFQTFSSAQVQVKKEEVTKEERKEHFEKYQMKSNQQAANNKVQEDKKKAAEAERIKNEDLAYLKSINDQVAYNNRINQIFFELELSRQEEIIQVQKQFKEENQQAVRNFILDKTQTKEESHNNYFEILKKETQKDENTNSDIVKKVVRDGEPAIEINPKADTEVVQKIAQQSEAVEKQADSHGNLQAASTASQVNIEANVVISFKEAEKEQQHSKLNFSGPIDEKNKESIEQQEEAYCKTQKIIKGYLPKVQKNIERIENNTAYSSEEKEERIKDAKNKLAESFKAQMEKSGLDVNDPKVKESMADAIADHYYDLASEEQKTEQKQEAKKEIEEISKLLPVDKKQVEKEVIKRDEQIEFDKNNPLTQKIEQQEQQQEKERNQQFFKELSKKDSSEIYSEMSTDKNNEQKGEIIQKGISENITEKAINNNGSIKESQKNTEDKSWAFEAAQNEEKRKDENSINKTSEEINKLNHSNEISNNPK